MNPFQNLTKENLHHAHLVISDFYLIREELFNFFENVLDVSTNGNELFYFKQYDKFLVKDAEEIFDLHLRKTPQNKIQLIVLNFNFINIESQNKMLKMLEEPRPRTYFFIIAPSRSLFLDTIFSRVEVLELGPSSFELRRDEAEKFLSMNIGERMKFIADLVKDIKDEKTVSAKGYGVTKQNAIDLLSGLEIELESRKDFAGLKNILEAKKYINLSGASVKILLETVALNI